MQPDVATLRANAVLNMLTDVELQQILPQLQLVNLPRAQLLYELAEPIGHVWFPITGVISLMQDVADDGVVEIGTVGHEGMAGLAVFLGAGAATERAVSQISGTSMRMSAADLRALVGTLDGPLQRALRAFTQVMFVQLGRNAACNRVHNVRQRAARWMLMSADRMNNDTFELTQEFLARTLAVRRASVSQVASALADDGCIRYTRGSITIVDAARLRASACECYDVVAQAARDAMGTS